jgi:hypothetical protein
MREPVASWPPRAVDVGVLEFVVDDSQAARRNRKARARRVRTTMLLVEESREHSGKKSHFQWNQGK